MRSVSDTGATAPISALTSALILVSNRGQSTDDLEQRIIAMTRLLARVSSSLTTSWHAARASAFVKVADVRRHAPRISLPTKQSPPSVRWGQVKG